MTIGSSPSPLQRHRRSTVSFAFAAWPRVKPFELHGTAQHEPATSSGIQTGCPARADSSTIASGSSRPPAGAPRALPKIRLTQAGM